MQIWYEMRELCTQHAVTAQLGLEYANMVRNPARGYRELGIQKMLQIWKEMHELCTSDTVTA